MRRTALAFMVGMSSISLCAQVFAAEGSAPRTMAPEKAQISAAPEIAAVTAAAQTKPDVPEPVPAGSDEFVVHEWGVQIRTKILVRHVDRMSLPSRPQGALQELLSAPAELISGLPDFVLIHNREYKPAKMSRPFHKPVLHFYGKEGMQVRVTVETPRGVPLAYWPKPELLEEVYWQMSSGVVDASGMSWQATLAARPSFKLPEVPPGHWWGRLREVPGLWLDAGTTSERFIFYEADTFHEHTLVGRVDGEALKIENRHAADSGPAVVIVNDNGRRRFVAIPGVGGGATVKVSRKALLSAEFAEEELLAACRAQWQAFGMTRQEAAAIVDTWKDDLLGRQGFLVISRVPREIYDALFPIKIDPRPDRIERAGAVFDDLPGEDARLDWLPGLREALGLWVRDLAAEGSAAQAEAVCRIVETGDLARPFLEEIAGSSAHASALQARQLLERMRPRSVEIPVRKDTYGFVSVHPAHQERKKRIENSHDLMEDMFASPNARHRRYAVRSFGEAGGSRAIPLLEKALADQDTAVRREAAAALGHIGVNRARDLLLKLLDEEKDRNMLAAVSAALKKGFPDDPSVIQALKDFKLPAKPRPEPKPQPEPEPVPAPQEEVF